MLFVGTFFICQFVLMMQFLWRYVDDLIGKGLSLDVLAQFFWYMGLMLMPQALPIAILLSSLIAFGNLGESSELTAIKAAGISLMQAFRSLIVIAVVIAGCSFYCQNYISPQAYKSLYGLLVSMKQTSPELEIPEGIFYSGIPGTNIYVEKKNIETGKLYGVTIYQIGDSYEDAAIILSDSGMLQSTAEKKHLLLTLYSGEWFENMKQKDVGGQAGVPYRRETFVEKRIVLDFDGEFNMTEVAGISAAAQAKELAAIADDLDSIRHYNDSVGYEYYRTSQRTVHNRSILDKNDSLRLARTVSPAVSAGLQNLLVADTAKTGGVADGGEVKDDIVAAKVDLDSVYQSLRAEERQNVVKAAIGEVRSHKMELNMRSDYTKGLHRTYRRHWIEAIKKFTLPISCLIFFFIGAPLGAIIRKGGLGVPVIISVLVYIIYYILENTGTKMARDDNWTLAFGTMLSTVVLTPLAAFVTYKANKDSAVFNMDFYVQLVSTLFGIRGKRNIAKKEVIIADPDYEADVRKLAEITDAITDYSRRHKLLLAPNPLKVFFRRGDDHRIAAINDDLEAVIADLSNAKDRKILRTLNEYPIVAPNAHTRPFERMWLNALVGIVVPVGTVLYLIMWRYRLRLMRDLKTIKAANDKIIARIEEGLRERAEREAAAKAESESASTETAAR